MNPDVEKAKLYFDLLKEGVRDKFNFLLYISGLTIALLVTGSLFPMTNILKVILSALLILGVLSLEVYLSEVTRATRAASKGFFKTLGKEDEYVALSPWGSIKFLLLGDENGKKSKKDFSERFASQFPAYALAMLWIIVIILVVLIWANTSSPDETSLRKPTTEQGWEK